MVANKMSTFEAAASLAKVCVGSGILALPGAVKRGGVMFSPIATSAVALWNIFAVNWMVECRDIVASRNMPAGVNSQYSRIAYGSYGWFGVLVADSALIITLLGVCVTYLITATSMTIDILKGVMVMGHTLTTCVLGLCLYPLSCAESVQRLSFVNLIALSSLLVGIGVLFWFGMESYYGDFTRGGLEDAIMYPKTTGDLTYYVGVAAFCFGLSSLVFPIEEGMANKAELNKAVVCALVFVISLYAFVGDGLYLLYMYDDRGIYGNILQNLPENSFAARLVRLSIIGVCMLSFPFTFLPPAQMIERYMMLSSDEPDPSQYEPIPSLERAVEDGRGVALASSKLKNDLPSSKKQEQEQEEEEEEETAGHGSSPLIRGILVAIITALATVVPCFGAIVSLLGAFSVTLITFVLPPVMHMALKQQEAAEAGRSIPQTQEEKDTLRRIVIVDCLATLAGTAMCLLATFTTLSSVEVELASGTC